jgi:hypothetical protein
MGARRRLRVLGEPGVPDVLADRQTDQRSIDLDQRGVGARLEVATLVEHPVVRELALAVGPSDLASSQHGQRVVGGGRGRVDQRIEVLELLGSPLHALRKPDQRGNPLDALRDAVESLAHRVEEVPAKDQVFRRVSR